MLKIKQHKENCNGIPRNYPVKIILSVGIATFFPFVQYYLTEGHFVSSAIIVKNDFEWSAYLSLNMVLFCRKWPPLNDCWGTAVCKFKILSPGIYLGAVKWERFLSVFVNHILSGLIAVSSAQMTVNEYLTLPSCELGSGRQKLSWEFWFRGVSLIRLRSIPS